MGSSRPSTATGGRLVIRIGDRLGKEAASYEKVGEFFDLWKGWYVDDSGDKIPVAIKVMRGAPAHNGELHKRVREMLKMHAEAWLSLKHPNVLPFYGISNDFGYLPALIVEYCGNGNIIEFLKDKELKPDYVLHLIRDIAHGLEYLHSKDIVHGDLRGSNILISNDGVPYLADFGLVFIIDHNEFTTSKIAGPARWTAPESLDPPENEDASPYTKESDIYAFAMTAVEVNFAILFSRALFHHPRLSVRYAPARLHSATEGTTAPSFSSLLRAVDRLCQISSGQESLFVR